MNDREARDPLSGELILGDPNTMTAQSRNLCQPLQLFIGKESKIFDRMTPLFEFMDLISDKDTMPEDLEDFEAFLTCVCCDMSASWKGQDSGGAAKQHNEPCQCCDWKSDNLAKPNELTCDRWCRHHIADDAEWQCFHRACATPEKVDEMKEEVESLKESLDAELEDIRRESKMVVADMEANPPPESSINNLFSIHFQPKTAEIREYSRLLTAHHSIFAHFWESQHSTRETS